MVQQQWIFCGSPGTRRSLACLCNVYGIGWCRQSAGQTVDLARLTTPSFQPAKGLRDPQGVIVGPIYVSSVRIPARRIRALIGWRR
ncbi:MAG TPA: hypothetical protein VK034_07770, partial [Enhygromyxa sp.]|nr:hypothetical protein [Enhygromyxa sp.]